MAAITVARQLCVNNQVVPVKVESLLFVDPYGNCDEAIQDLTLLNASLVSFASSRTKSWLRKALALPTSRWWMNNHGRIPLLQEILHLIRGKKNPMGQGP